MNILSNRKYIPIFIALTVGFLVITMMLVPSERSLGKIIKLVLLHAALIQTGLVLFAVAAVFAIAYLFKKNNKSYQFCLAIQKTAVVTWVLYVLSSMLVTYLAWGKAIVWEEPRVQSSAFILFFSIIILALVVWIGNNAFTAIANIIMAILAWGLTKQAGIVQHPADPIGLSDSVFLKVFFYVIFLLVLFFALQVFRMFCKPAAIAIDEDSIHENS